MAETVTDAIQNPLYGIKTGSIVFSETGRFELPVIKDGLTKFISQQSGAMSMTGNSDYVYTDQMNQGSLGVSGSYGVSGLSKLTSSVSAYVGNTSAQNENTLSITLHSVKWAGVEYIDLNELSAGDLMNGLAKAVGAHAKDVLEKYNAMRTAFAGKKPADIFQILKAVKPDKKDADARQAFEEWNLAAARFLQTHGTGIVIATVWGGWGAVSLEFKSTSEENRWEAGGSGKFSYATPGGAIDAEATYGHSQSFMGKHANVQVSSYYNGRCMEKLVSDWFADLKAKAAKGLELGKENITKNAALSKPLPAPKAPKFLKPEKEKSITELMGKIRDLDGLQAYAKASAWEKHKAGGGQLSLEDFLKDADQKADTSAVPRLARLDEDEEDFGPDDELLEDAGPAGRGRRDVVFADNEPEPKPKPAAAAAPKDAPGKAGDPFADFEPMGVWIVNWSQLFPWLVSGYSNEIPKDNIAGQLVELKTLQQDLIALQKLYQRFFQSKLAASGVTPPLFGAMADSFGNRAAAISEFIRKNVADPKTAANRAELGGRIKTYIDKVKSHLSPDAKAVYDTWAGSELYRSCELGLGICMRPLTAPDGWQSISGSTFDAMHNLPVTLRPCNFDLKTRNFDAFSRFVKGAPLILPVSDGKGGRICQIYLYVNDLKFERSGFLAFRQADFTITKTPDEHTPAIEMKEKTESKDTAGDRKPLKFLRAETIFFFKSEICLYPIPFRAARGVATWTGSAFATGMGTLGAQIDVVRRMLAKKNRWSFDGDFWTDKEWTDEAYSFHRLSLSYLGVTPEPPNVLPHA